MNRNVNSRFALARPALDMPRSRFAMNQSIKLSGNIGDLIPFYINEVLPGDTFSQDTSMVVRLQPLVAPIMDNVYLDTYYFFVPNRLVWEHWQEFCGENNDSAWIPQASYSIPQITSPASTGWSVGTIADYFGIPTGVAGLSVNALPFRAYALICQDWFRSENLTDPLNIPVNDSTQTGTNGGSYINDVANGGLPFKAAKYFDYFTGALPSPQKGPDVAINLGQLSDTIPVVGNGLQLGLSDGTHNYGLGNPGAAANLSGRASLGAELGTNTSTGGTVATSQNINLGVPTKTLLGDHLENSGLVGILDGIQTESMITINQLRQAFQVQKFYEQSARGGTRYIELLKQMFGVTSPDARLQRPEYLGGKRIPVNINQVIQTSETTSGGTPQGNTAAYSLTADTHSDFTHSFVEHGFVIGLMVARYDHTYQQGIEKFWSRTSRFDYYWPVFANLGEMAIKNKEIYAQGSSAVNADTGVAYDEEVFGYQEAWADYRYKPSRVAGEMRSTYATSLDVWHLGDEYNALPSLSDAWIREDKTNLDRALAVTSSVSNQFIADIYVKCNATRCMPVYSIPGLIDHH